MSMVREWLVVWGWLPLFVITVAVALVTRPIMPVDETRYLGVAWEMWSTGSWVVPLLDGEPYSHKPPLLFWLIHVGWFVFGVNEISARLVAPAFALGSLLLVRAVARRLFPDRRAVATFAPWVLSGTIYWLGFATMTMFDQLVVFFVLLGVLGLLEIGRGHRQGWLWLFIATALGTLAKGPFALIYLVPLTVAAPWWAGVPRSWRWFVQAGSVGFMGSSVALGWALWAAQLGGPAYAEEILWGQLAGRAVAAFDHAEPFYYYLWVLPLLFLPWTLLLPGLRHGARGAWQGRGGSGDRPDAYRLILTWIGVPFVLLSLASGKLPHYLLPMLPALSIATACLLAAPGNAERPLGAPWVSLFWLLVAVALIALPWIDSSPVLARVPGWVSAALGVLLAFAAVWLWRERPGPRQVVSVTAITMLALVSLHLVFVPMRPAYDFKAFATQVGQWQRDGRTVAFVGKYRDEYHFHGRLEESIVVLNRGEDAVADFCARYPDGVVVRRTKGEIPRGAIAVTPFRSKHDVAMPCSALMPAKPGG